MNIEERRVAVAEQLANGGFSQGMKTRFAKRFGCSSAAIHSDVIALTTTAEDHIYTSAIVRQAIINRDGFVCQYCGTDDQEANWFVVEHVVPAIKGGPARPFNLVVACHPCNCRKRSRVWVPRNLDLIAAEYPEWRAKILKMAGEDKMPEKPAKRKPGPVPHLDSPVKFGTQLTAATRDRLFAYADAHGISVAAATRQAIDLMTNSEKSATPD